MIRQPRIGQAVRLHYARRKLAAAPHHGAVGHVVAVGAGPGPRNVGVRLPDRVVVVPRGNLVPAEPAPCP